MSDEWEKEKTTGGADPSLHTSCLAAFKLLPHFSSLSLPLKAISHFLTCRFVSFVMDICCLYPLWYLFLKIRWPNLNQRVSDIRNLNHIHKFNAKSLMTFFLADHVTNSGQMSSRITNPVKCDGATDARILMDPSPAWCQFHIPGSWTSISSYKKALFAGLWSCVCWWPSISLVANVNKAYYGVKYEAQIMRLRNLGDDKISFSVGCLMSCLT